jgi:ABC-type glycerol-3-phosphate transport system substrate-binding protein
VDVTAVVPQGSGLAADWQLPISEWEAARGTCRVEEAALSDPGGGPSSLPGGTALLVAPLPLVPELVDAGWLSPLDPKSDAGAMAVWQDLYGGLRQGWAAPGRRPALIPLDVPVLACYYRADLLAAAGHKPPETWRDYQQLLDALGEWAPGLTAVEPWHPDFRATAFLARAVSSALHPDNLSLYVDLETGRPLIGGPPFVRALEEARAALARLDPRSLDLQPADCYREVAAGRAALAVGLPVLDESPVERGVDVRIGVAPLPGSDRVYHGQLGTWSPPTDDRKVNRVTLVGFDGLAVCVSAHVPIEVQRAAWELWASIDAQEEEEDAGRPGRRLCRASAAADVARNPPAGWPVEEWRAQVRTVTGALDATRVVPDLPLPQRWEFRDRLTSRLSEALDGRRPPEEALRLAAEDWQALIDQIGARRVRNTCRQCSGLSALPPE